MCVCVTGDVLLGHFKTSKVTESDCVSSSIEVICFAVSFMMCVCVCVGWSGYKPVYVCVLVCVFCCGVRSDGDAATVSS